MRIISSFLAIVNLDQAPTLGRQIRGSKIPLSLNQMHSGENKNKID
jgi:hypothetical protein